MMNKTLMPHQPLMKNEPIASPGCSIPSRYQTFVIDNSDRKGFNSGTRRFGEFEQSDTPGPGHYNPSNHEIKKGLIRKRFGKKRHIYQSKTSPNLNESYNKSNQIYDCVLTKSKFQTPGPNNYNISKPLSMRKDFHRAHSSSFQSVRRDSNLFSTPAPNAYNPKNRETKSISSPFRSNTIRDSDEITKKSGNIPRAKRVPSPTHYLVRDTAIKQNVRAPTSCFMSTTNRSEICYKTTKGAYYADSKYNSNRNPGPGSYGNLPRWGHSFTNKNEMNKTKGHYLAISAPAIPLPPAKSLPGPGQYELVDYKGPDKKNRVSSMFRSNTDRWHNELRNIFISKQAPGPASYNPKSIRKQSFIFNADNRWIN